MAVDTFRKSLTDKEFSRVTAPSGPQDVVREVERWRSQQSSSKYAKSCANVRNGLARMEKFTGAIDVIAQGSPAPGCLLWGGVKVALTVSIRVHTAKLPHCASLWPDFLHPLSLSSHQGIGSLTSVVPINLTNEEKLVKGVAEEYSKLCAALSQMTDCLPRIELYTEAFLTSNLVQDCVNQFYVSMLKFWTRACKFYSRHRLWNIIRVVWNDFDDEFRGTAARYD